MTYRDSASEKQTQLPYWNCWLPPPAFKNYTLLHNCALSWLSHFPRLRLDIAVRIQARKCIHKDAFMCYTSLTVLEGEKSLCRTSSVKLHTLANIISDNNASLKRIYLWFLCPNIIIKMRRWGAFNETLSFFSNFSQSRPSLLRSSCLFILYF